MTSLAVRRLTAGLLSFAACSAVLAGCGLTTATRTTAEPVPAVVTSPTTTTGGSHATSRPSDTLARRQGPTPAPTSTTTSRRDTTGLAASFAALRSRLGGEVGFAVAPVGPESGTDDVTRMGPLQSDVAWSTSKVPLAIDALRRGATASVPSNIRAAITASDNAAAQRLWDGLGGGTAAGTAVDKVLRTMGDTHTVTNTRRIRPAYTAFGQTVWTATDQARTAASLSCSTDPNARTVYRLMGQVEAGQAWGLGRHAGSHFKGGWGPDRSGRYLVRQMGVVSRGGHPIMGVSILAKPADGSFSAAIAQIDAVTTWLYDHLQSLPAGHC